MKKKGIKKNYDLAQEWFLRARDDEISSKSILEDQDGSPNTVCFLSQQMVEKYLKGFLVFHGIRFPKIHHLDKLLNICMDINHDFEKFSSIAEELSEFYISTRYPGEYIEFHFDDASDAFEKALKIKSFILDEIKKTK